jgi:transposase
VPPPAIRELRDLTRYRVQQVRDRSQEVNRLCKVLEDAAETPQYPPRPSVSRRTGATPR